MSNTRTPSRTSEVDDYRNDEETVVETRDRSIKPWLMIHRVWLGLRRREPYKVRGLRLSIAISGLPRRCHCIFPSTTHASVSAPHRRNVGCFLLLS